MTFCSELQQSHEMDYQTGTHFAMNLLHDISNLANMYYAQKRSDAGCLYQIDTR